MDFSGKTAIVTGAGQGVGQGIALALAAAGAAVVVAGRTLGKVESTAKLIESRGGKALAVACNVKDAADLGALVAAAQNAFGGVVVNWIMAKADLDGNIIEVIAQGP